MGFSVTGSTYNSGNGIDVQGAVNQLVYAARAPERVWQAQQSELQSEATTLKRLNSELSALSNAIDTLNDPAGILEAVTVTSSQASSVSGTATAGTATGTHQLQVDTLATLSSAYSKGYASPDEIIPDDSFSIQVGEGIVTTVDIGSNHNTLNTIADYINSSDMGVTAAVISDATGSRLSIISKSTGTVGDITVTSGTGFSVEKGIAGVNASITLDGVPLSFSSNEIENAIPGLTLNLNAATTGTATISIKPGATSTKKAISDFVVAYNNLMNDLNSQFTFNPGSGSAGPLAGNVSARLVQQELLGVASYSGSGAIVTMSGLGLSMNNDGTLSVDDAKLSDAITNKFEALSEFLKGDGQSGFLSSIAERLDSLTDSTEGAFNVELESNAAIQRDLTRHIEDFEIYIAARQDSWTAEYNRINVMLEQMPSSIAFIQAQLGLDSGK